MTGPRARTAARLTDIAVWIREQIGGETDPQQALERAADEIGEIAMRLMDGHPEADTDPERDPELEAWLRRELERARSRPAGPGDLAVIRDLAAMEDGGIASAVGFWLRESRAAGQ